MAKQNKRNLPPPFFGVNIQGKRMKKIYLHGALGKRFGKEWSLDVSSASEAISALFANEPKIAKYINKKYQEGISYGVKKGANKNFLQKEDYTLNTNKDLHVFPVPEGSASFAVNLLSMAVTTAVGMMIQKKMAEAMKRDDSTLVAQTQSFIYSGGDNRFQQGSTIPLGYGALKVGTNVISSSITNFDYDSDKNEIINVENNIYSLIPSYYKPEEVYFSELGPLASSYLYKFFDSNGSFRITSKNYQLIKSIIPSINFGSNDGIYGEFINRDTQLSNITSIKEKKGDAIAGYYYYEWNFSKGVDTTRLPNFSEGSPGNWRPNTEESSGGFDYQVDESQAMKSSYICLQSEPQLEKLNLSKKFYPTSFSEGGPIQVGQRWKGGSKENGVGWFKLESVSLYKAIDLVCEGPIDGFCNKNIKSLDFKRDVKLEPNSLRNPDDDYLQGVFLDDTPVKEVNYKKETDSYNINEFDIDISTNSKEEIGVEDQNPLEEKYLFTYNTKEINERLFGPKNISTESSYSTKGVGQFKFKKIYSKNQLVSQDENVYKVDVDISNEFNQNENYSSQINGDPLIVYKGKEDDARFYKAKTEIDDFIDFDYSKNDYSSGDKIKSRLPDGSIEYYILGSDASKYIGEYVDGDDYSDKTNHIVSRKNVLYKILADGELEMIKATIFDEKNEIDVSVFDSPIYIISNTEDPDISGLNFATIQSIDPTNSQDLWGEIIIKSTREINDIDGNKVDIKIFTFSGENNLEEKFDSDEENYISHTVINPLVEQLYVSLSIDELAYVYEGDHLEVTYKIGELMKYLLGGMTVYYAAKTVISGLKAVAAAAQAGASIDPATKAAEAKKAAEHGKTAAESGAMATILGVMTGYIIKNDEWKIGTKIENSGEMWPNKAKFRIKYGNQNEEMYSTDVLVYGVATSSYRKDVKIYLPPNPKQKDRIIKVYKLNRERNLVEEGEQAARYKENFSLASITEISPIVMNYPNSVIIGTRINARDYSKMPTRNFHLKLKKVAIPSNYDPIKRKYSGSWNGLFKGQKNKNDSIPTSSMHWTDNPAWCLYDLISNKRYGVGKFGIKAEHVDRWTLYRIAKYCDESVPTGYSSKYTKRSFVVNGSKAVKINVETSYDSVDFGEEFNYPGNQLGFFYDDNTYESITIDHVDPSEKVIYLESEPVKEFGLCATSIDYPLIEPRYTINAFIMDQQNAFKLINEFASIFRAFAYWSGGAINFFQDEKRDAVMLFTNNNVSDQGFSYSSTPKTSRTNACKIKYLDRYNMYRPKIEYSEDKEAIKDNNIIEQTVDGFGITSQAQAKRAADFVVKTANSETELISFDTSSIGSYLKPGDVVEVLDQKRNLGKFSGKVLNLNIAEDGKSAEIDIDYPIRTIIDPLNKETWKKITLYLPEQNQSISSLDEAGQVTDQDILNIRAPQIQEYLISEITENDTKLILTNNTYSYIDGEFTWTKAISNAQERGGILATIESEQDQKFANFVLPQNKKAWIAGFKNDNNEYAWFNSEACEDGGSALNYQNWASGQPDTSEDYIYIQGSTDNSHGNWLTDNHADLKGYILDKPSDSPLFDLRDSEGVSFIMEDNVHFANKKKYKILSIEESGQGTFKVQGLEYDEEKFDNIEKDISIKPPESPVIFTEQPLDAPSNVTLQILSEDVDQEVPYGLRVVWTEVSGAISYRVQFFSGNILMGSFEIPSKNQSSMQYDFRDPRITENGSYYARIYTRGQ